MGAGGRLPVIPARAQGRRGLVEAARHRLSTPGSPRIDLTHYPDHPQEPDGAPRPPTIRARSDAERAFLSLGEGARQWLIEASAVGTVRIRANMADAVELAALRGTAAVDAALGVAAVAGRFAEADLASITEHQATVGADTGRVAADESHPAQPGTGGWAGFTTTAGATSVDAPATGHVL